MAGARAAERAAERTDDPDPRVLRTLRACQDVVERLERSAVDVTLPQVEIALGVVKQAIVDLTASSATNAVIGAVRNAADRLQKLRDELKT